MIRFDIREAAIDNAFLRQGDVAAHVLAGSAPEPRIVVAFPAGNSGCGLWLEAPGSELRIAAPLEALRCGDLRGVATAVDTGVRTLVIRRFALGNIRMLREVDRGAAVPDRFAARLERRDGALVAERRSLDGARTYRLEVELPAAAEIEERGDGVALRAPEPIRLAIAALTDEPPLTPLADRELLDPGAGSDRRAREVLSFLAYREKLCAGSWRFLTYFGRDTLLTVQLMMPVLASEAIEAGLASVLDRLSADGRVAHEEELGEWALHRTGASPAFDHSMVDDDFMLAPVAARYLLDDRRGAGRREAFLGREGAAGARYGRLLARNLELVLARARPFAESGELGDLIRIEAGSRVGNWRDSQTGLAGGAYPWDVNAALVPAALEAAARLAPHLPDAPSPAAFEAALPGWRRARCAFEIEIEAATATRRFRDWAASLGLDVDLELDGPVAIDALALDDELRPIPVLHSDLGYSLLFSRPGAPELERALALLERPFPAGLLTPVGMVVASPALASAAQQKGLTPGRYHGAVMWPWQHAMWILGLRAAAARADLPPPLRGRIESAAARLEAAAASVPELRTAELWSWRAAGREIEAIPFGQDESHRAESNAAQLWSTIELALR